MFWVLGKMGEMNERERERIGLGLYLIFFFFLQGREAGERKE